MNASELITKSGLDHVVVDAKAYQTLLDLLEEVYDLGIEEGRDREWDSTHGEQW
jgi:hypothetical protein